MNVDNPYWQRLEADLLDTSGIIVPKGEDEEMYFEKLRESIRTNATELTIVSAKVVKPGFKHRELGSVITGYLLAQVKLYWLVFEPSEEEYYCIWGTEVNSLAAYGVMGNPLYCWWD